MAEPAIVKLSALLFFFLLSVACKLVIMLLNQSLPLYSLLILSLERDIWNWNLHLIT